jgi:hypothetical protein
MKPVCPAEEAGMSLFKFGAGKAEDERDYWLDRAEFHLDLGEKTADTRASWAHFQLAGRYLDKAYGGGKTEAEAAMAEALV